MLLYTLLSTAILDNHISKGYLRSMESGEETTQAMKKQTQEEVVTYESDETEKV